MGSVARGARATLSVYLVLWLGLFPVLQAAHLAFANHGHCFCREHFRIEDVPRLDSSSSRAGAEPEDRARRHFSRAPSASSGQADQLLNFSLHNATAKRVQQAWVLYNDCFQKLLYRPSQQVASFPHILIAPKTSPPIFLSA